MKKNDLLIFRVSKPKIQKPDFNRMLMTSSAPFAAPEVIDSTVCRRILKVSNCGKEALINFKGRKRWIPIQHNMKVISN